MFCSQRMYTIPPDRVMGQRTTLTYLRLYAFSVQKRLAALYDEEERGSASSPDVVSHAHSCHCWTDFVY
jgi:hypothetical protein